MWAANGAATHSGQVRIQNRRIGMRKAGILKFFIIAGFRRPREGSLAYSGGFSVRSVTLSPTNRSAASLSAFSTFQIHK